MAASLKASIHVRSNSLPTRTHPQILSVEEQLQKLIASTESQKLFGLKDLYEYVDDLLQLPHAKQALSCEKHSERVEQILDGSLRLVDTCDSTKDVFSQMECVQELESSLRRRRGGESGFANEVNAYMISKKKFSKAIRKLSENLKRIQRESTSNKASDDQVAMVTTLRKVEEISLAVFESLLSSIRGQKSSSKLNRLSLFSKHLQSKRVSCEGEAQISEMEKLDMELLALNGQNSNKDINMQSFLKQMEALEFSIQEVEEDLECIYRRLVKTRVSLLNILNH